jgi:cyclic pyranopterin phosphate synthase
MFPVDTRQRPLRRLRISVTDRCSLRCGYCMPEDEYHWLPRNDLLSFEEIARLAETFASLGVRKLRLTGGEPLLRRDLATLIRMLYAVDGIEDVALTTNGPLLGEQADSLAAAGLRRVTVSLDTLDRQRFTELTRRDELPRVMASLRTARAAGIDKLKLNTVVIRGKNDDELVPLLEFARSIGIEQRFIEYMDVAGATGWTSSSVLSRDEILARLGARLGRIETLAAEEWAPAVRYRLADGTVFGIVASTTAPFCGTCDRGRLTADGMFLSCLYATGGLDLRGPLRAGRGPEELRALLDRTWSTRADRGAEERLEEDARAAFVPVDELRANPHLEMHTRGG